MDMDSSHPNCNWLVFSLSNTSSLFHPLSTSTPQDAATATSLLGAAAPKLEDFLGGANMPDHVDMYDDSELKSIAAGFLRGFSSQQPHKHLAVAPPPDAPPKKVADNFGQRTSVFRGVTRHRWTGRYEAHLWDNSCRREGQSRKGRQVYLGGYDKEEKAARAYDLAALKYWGPTTTTNFPVAHYEREMEEMKHMTRQEFVASLRRKSSGFSREPQFTEEHHQHGRWQARIGRVAGNKDLYLGTFSTQEEAAEAYDIAAIKFRGLNAVTNFDMSRYDVKSIANSNLPVGTVNKSKTTSESASENKSVDGILLEDSNKDLSSATSASFPSHNPTATINFTLPMKQDQSSSNLWAALGYQSPAMANTHPKNPSVQTLQSTTPFSMEYHHATEISNDNNEGFFSGCGYYPESSGTTSSSGSVATRMVSSNGTTHDAVGFTNNGGWIQSMHAFQAAKTNLSSFQTPIFGME